MGLGVERAEDVDQGLHCRAKPSQDCTNASWRANPTEYGTWGSDTGL